MMGEMNRCKQREVEMYGEKIAITAGAMKQLYDELVADHYAAIRRAKAEGVRECERERDELSKDLEDVRKQLAGYKDQHRRDREYISRLQKELGHGQGEVMR